MTTTQLETTSLLARPHHDGSEAYVLEHPDELGDEAVVRVRTPQGSVEDVVLRYLRDGEPGWSRAQVDGETESETWWRASFPLANPSVPYRWLLVGADGGWSWLTGAGVRAHECPDADDFVLALGAGPDWHLSSVVYEIFPDRFARLRARRRAARVGDSASLGRASDGQRPETRRASGSAVTSEGSRERLEHVERLGANALYLTPIFPATSTHRYDSTTFDRIDPLLGGDEALGSSRGRARRGLRVLGDLTTNHTGDGHEWFRAALDDPDARERDLYYFDPALPNGYASWWGVPSLPKLDWRSPELRRRMLDVTRRWLESGSTAGASTSRT